MQGRRVFSFLSTKKPAPAGDEEYLLKVLVAVWNRGQIQKLLVDLLGQGGNPNLETGGPKKHCVLKLLPHDRTLPEDQSMRIMQC